ncbi:MAG: LytR/AlgR family response regulator transcription factor [Sedimentibacter sp.]
MLRIAICDDEKVICQQLEDILCEISENIHQEIETEVYYSGEELCNFLYNGNSYNIIFLDIELCEINGVEVGKKIRNELNDEYTQIVYISSKESYAMELFEVRPLNFLIKPFSKEKIESVLLKAIKLLDKGNHFFEYKNGNITFSVKINDILYFESNGRKVDIVLSDETKSFYGKLSTVEEQLSNQDFVMIHKSYLINFNFCIEYTYEYVKMSNQEILTISQNNRKAVREKLMQRKLRMRHDK